MTNLQLTCEILGISVYDYESYYNRLYMEVPKKRGKAIDFFISKEYDKLDEDDKKLILGQLKNDLEIDFITHHANVLLRRIDYLNEKSQKYETSIR